MLAWMPLLHVAPITTSSVDQRLLVLTSLAAILFTWHLWFPEQERGLRRHLVRAGAARVTMTALLLAAVSPSVVPFDHLFFHSDNTPAEEAVHAAHCHVAPGSCADAPLSAGPGQLIFNTPLIVEPAMLSVSVHIGTATLAGRSVPPDLRPPVA
jgi:hypothetical protein